MILRCGKAIAFHWAWEHRKWQLRPDINLWQQPLQKCLSWTQEKHQRLLLRAGVSLGKILLDCGNSWYLNVIFTCINSRFAAVHTFEEWLSLFSDIFPFCCSFLCFSPVLFSLILTVWYNSHAYQQRHSWI